MSISKESWVSTTVRRFLQGIWFYTQRKKNGENTSCIWSLQRNCYRYNDTLQKHESNISFTWLRHRYRHYCSSPARKCICTIFVNALPRLRTLNINRINKRNGFTLKKKKERQEADDIPQKWWHTQNTQMIYHFTQMHRPKMNPYYIT